MKGRGVMSRGALSVCIEPCGYSTLVILQHQSDKSR